MGSRQQVTIGEAVSVIGGVQVAAAGTPAPRPRSYLHLPAADLGGCAHASTACHRPAA